MKRKPLKPLIRGGGYLPSDDYTPLVYPGGKTTLDAKDDPPEDANEEQDTKTTTGE